MEDNAKHVIQFISVQTSVHGSSLIRINLHIKQNGFIMILTLSSVISDNWRVKFFFPEIYRDILCIKSVSHENCCQRFLDPRSGFDRLYIWMWKLLQEMIRKKNQLIFLHGDRPTIYLRSCPRTFLFLFFF